MLNRHRPEGEPVDLFPSGALDPKNPRYIPEELRADYIAINDEEESKMRRRLRGVTPPAHTIGGRLVALDPANSDADFETLVVWEKLTLARNQQRNRQAQADLELSDARQYTCSACREVHPVEVSGRYTKWRRLPDGRDLFVCQQCFDVLDVLARDHLTTQRLVTGESRGEACARLYERSLQ